MNSFFMQKVIMIHVDWKLRLICYISGEIVERGIRAHPELAIGAQADPEGAPRCIGNPPSLQSSGLAQALNLRAAIEYREGNS